MARTNDLTQHRLGMAVSRKVCAKAVGRNRIKRVIRENFRCNMLGGMTGKALDIVVLPTARAVNQSNRTLDESLLNHWQKLSQKAGSQEPGVQVDQLRIHR